MGSLEQVFHKSVHLKNKSVSRPAKILIGNLVTVCSIKREVIYLFLGSTVGHLQSVFTNGHLGDHPFGQGQRLSCLFSWDQCFEWKHQQGESIGPQGVESTMSGTLMARAKVRHLISFGHGAIFQFYPRWRLGNLMISTIFQSHELL